MMPGTLHHKHNISYWCICVKHSGYQLPYIYIFSDWLFLNRQGTFFSSSISERTLSYQQSAFASRKHARIHDWTHQLLLQDLWSNISKKSSKNFCSRSATSRWKATVTSSSSGWPAGKVSAMSWVRACFSLASDSAWTSTGRKISSVAMLPKCLQYFPKLPHKVLVYAEFGGWWVKTRCSWLFCAFVASFFGPLVPENP